jgi:hypothetical protein
MARRYQAPHNIVMPSKMDVQRGVGVGKARQGKARLKEKEAAKAKGKE